MRIIILALVCLLSQTIGIDFAEARPGGGHSSFGHGSPFSYEPSSPNSFSYQPSISPQYGYVNGIAISNSPMAMMFFLLLMIIIIVVLKNQNNIQSYTSEPTPFNKLELQNKLNHEITLLKQRDPNFSKILFLDFIHSLYCKFYSYSTHPEFSYLSPFLSIELQQHFQQADTWVVNEIVINAISWQEVNTQDNEIESICLVIDANYTLHLKAKHTRYAVTERWLLYRQKDLRSPEPEKMQTLCCPYCGAPAHFTDSGLCGHCGNTVHQGEQQWYLAKRAVLRTTALETGDLVSYAPEQGTQLTTIKQSDLEQQILAFQQLHAITDWHDFWEHFTQETVTRYFLAIYSSWSRRDWQTVRHLLSDRLYEANSFWLNLYAQHNWFNRLDDIKISQIELAKIEIDRFYEAVTVRVFASCYDYTEDEKGILIGGSKRSLRRYSEYWTFVRRKGVEQHDKPYSLSQCPQCGAPADNMGQTAECGYCGSKISTGKFSWVLFLIMQDDNYSE